jgi:hypothetical protein
MNPDLATDVRSTNSENDENALLALPAPPETIVSVRNLTLVVKKNDSKLVQKLKARRRKKPEQIEDGKVDVKATQLHLAAGEHSASTKTGRYVGENANDRPELEGEPEAEQSDGRKVILNDVSCECYPREMLAM